MKPDYFAIETTYDDGRKVYRFVKVDSYGASRQFAIEQADRFSRNAGVYDTRIFHASEKEVATIKAAQRPAREATKSGS